MPKINEASATSGVKSFPIEGPMESQYYRLAGMTDQERAWRRQWIKDQVLHESEPQPVKGYYQARYNPIRRFYMWPLNQIFMKFVPKFGYERAAMARYYTGRIFLGYALVILAAYNLTYHTNDWQRQGGWRLHYNRERVLPGDDRFPFTGDKKVSSDYYKMGFENSPI